jgi:lipoprotein-anchoring transpeptidase ErfK/SrfK
MFNTLPLLVASVLSLTADDSIKKKGPVLPPPTARRATASSAIARATSQTITRFAGPAVGKTITSVAREARPRAMYLASAIESRLAGRAIGGPPLPDKFRSNDNIASIVADSIVVEKSRHTMTLYNQGTPVRIYFVALGKSPVGPKIAKGDGRTPEGIYYIAGHNPDSKYHLSLAVSYPNERDLSIARARGVTTGGDIMIHGLPPQFSSYGPAHRLTDWTLGCIAVTNAEIEEIWSAIPDGATIQIKP